MNQEEIAVAAEKWWRRDAGLPVYPYHSHADIVCAFGSDNLGYFTKDGGDLVSRWWDERSGDDSLNYMKQDTGPNQPLYVSGSGLQFNTTDSFTSNAAITFGTAFSFIWVLSHTSSGLHWDLANIDASNKFQLRTGETFRVRIGGANDESGAVSEGTTHIIAVRRDGSDLNMRVDGAAWTSHVCNAGSMGSESNFFVGGDGRFTESWIKFSSDITEATMDSYITGINSRYSAF